MTTILRADPPEMTPGHYEAAEERLLADIDSYMDWLGAACLSHSNVQLGYVPSDKAALQELIDGMTLPQLVALSLYPSPAPAAAAMWELRCRYIAAHADYLKRLADEAYSDDVANREFLAERHAKASARRFSGEPLTGWGSV